MRTRVIKSTLSKNLLISISGTGIAQLIHLAATPILTRVYSPSQFGEYSLFLSILALLAVFSTMKYDLAILIANTLEKYILLKFIRKFSLILALIIFILSLAALFVQEITYSITLIFLSLSAYASGIFWGNRAMLNSNGKFKELSLGKILENVINSVLAISLAFTSLKSFSLMLSKSIAIAISAFYFHKKATASIKGKLSSIQENQVLKKYADFPKFSVLSELIVQLNLSITIILFTQLFGADEAGYIGLTTRVLSFPISFISISFLDVFKNTATRDFEKTGSCKRTFIKFAIILTGLAAPFVLVTNLYALEIFSYIFGGEWTKAGEYAQILAILYAIRLIASPLGFTLFLNGAQKQNLLFQFLFVSVAIITIYGSYIMGESSINVIKNYTFTISFLYFTFIYYSFIHTTKTNS